MATGLIPTSILTQGPNNATFLNATLTGSTAIPDGIGAEIGFGTGPFAKFGSINGTGSAVFTQLNITPDGNSAHNVADIDVAGNASFPSVTTNGVKFTLPTLAQLISAHPPAGLFGFRAVISDSNAAYDGANLGNIAVGGGVAVPVCPVISNGTNYIIG